jgi:pyruvate dehydrogenase E1 component
VSAATSYSVNDTPMIPFYIYYSMFGFQRIGDLAWAAGDMRARGFLVGGTSGRTTLNGEGLQHQDGHSHILANTIPNCISYDPTYGYEIAVIVQDGIRRMYGEDQEDIFYYLTTMNENYVQPEMPQGVEEGIVKGIYKLESVAGSGKGKVQLMGCGTILEQVRKAAQALAKDFGISTDVFSVTSFNELARDGQAVERWNMLHPTETAKVPYVSTVLAKDAPAIVATDYMKIYGEQLRAYVPCDYKVLGTDGFGRSDSRANLRHHFEVDAKFIVVAALKSLVDRNELPVDVLAKTIAEYGIDADKIDPQHA